MSVIKCRYCGKVLPSMVAYHICLNKNKAPKWKNKVGKDTMRALKTRDELDLERIEHLETRRHKAIIRDIRLDNKLKLQQRLGKVKLK